MTKTNYESKLIIFSYKCQIVLMHFAAKKKTKSNVVSLDFMLFLSQSLFFSFVLVYFIFSSFGVLFKKKDYN